MVLSLLFLSIAAFAAGVAADCNPLTTNGCAAIPGLSSSSYSVDFTQVKSLPPDWILADGSDVSFGSNGIQFNFNKRKAAPYIWTNFYVAYGKIDVVMQVASGTGLITSAVMFSDDADEIDWEFSGSNLGAGVGNGKAQTNVFGKGMTGNYDRGTLVNVSPTPQTSFHTYTINWTPDKIDWIIDGSTIRTENNKGYKSGNYQFPQTPSRLHLGVWDAGDPDTAPGTRQWAGGLTDYSKLPYIAYVRSVKITTPNPCKAWKYPDNFSGSWADVKCSNENIPNTTPASPTSTSAAPKNTDATYTVIQGDNGYSIASKLGTTFDQLQASNPGVKWDFLNIGQKLQNPNAAATTRSSNSSSSSSSSSISASKSSYSSTSSTTQSASPRVTSSSTTTTDYLKGLNPPQPSPKSMTTKTSSPSSTTSTQLARSSSYSCSQDACYNSMTATQFITPALSFCSAAGTTSVATPTFLTGCQSDSNRIRSACSCLTNTYSTTSTVTTTTASSSKTAATTSKATAIMAHHGWGGWSRGNNGKWGGWGRG